MNYNLFYKKFPEIQNEYITLHVQQSSEHLAGVESQLYAFFVFFGGSTPESLLKMRKKTTFDRYVSEKQWMITKKFTF